MNKTSADKIKLAVPFFIWFRRCLPQNLQTEVRPYLDSPYQLALNILDCCDSSQPLKVGAIAQSAGVARETARQVLQALREGGMPFVVSPTREWQAVSGHFDRATSLTAVHPEVNGLQEFFERVATR
jgi:hypothetical protein